MTALAQARAEQARCGAILQAHPEWRDSDERRLSALKGVITKLKRAASGGPNANR